MPAHDDSGMPSAPDGHPAGDPAGPRTPTFLRRFGALLVDWLLSQLLTLALLGTQPGGGAVAAFTPLAIFALLNIVAIALTGSTPGHRLFGMQVWQVRPGFFPGQVVVRTLLLCLFVPAVVSGSDGRGLHDIAAGTRIVRP